MKVWLQIYMKDFNGHIYTGASIEINDKKQNCLAIIKI